MYWVTVARPFYCIIVNSCIRTRAHRNYLGKLQSEVSGESATNYFCFQAFFHAQPFDWSAGNPMGAHAHAAMNQQMMYNMPQLQQHTANAATPATVVKVRILAPCIVYLT